MGLKTHPVFLEYAMKNISRVIITDDTGMKYLFYSDNQGIEVKEEDGGDTLVIRQRPLTVRGHPPSKQ